MALTTSTTGRPIPGPRGLPILGMMPEMISDMLGLFTYPFGEGPHVCIGNNFALMEMQLILCMALQRFRLRLVPDHPVAFKPEATLRPKYGMKMTVESI